MESDHGEQTKSIAARHRLSSCSSRRNIETNDHHRVKTSLSDVLFISSIDICFSCVIGTMCDPQIEFQRINPTTQVALYSLCPNNCSNLLEITWKIYRGSINSSLNNVTEWTLFNRTDQQENQWFFGNLVCLFPEYL